VPSQPSGATTYFMTVVGAGGGVGPSAQCLPMPLPRNSTGEVACQIFFALAAGDTCAAHPGLSAADPLAATAVRDSQALSPSVPMCLVPQLPGPCAASSQAGWCYNAGTAAASRCAQWISFSPSAEPSRDTFIAIACP
jgi:hypothetical protein